MPLQSIYQPEHYTGNGSTANLPFNWRILAKTDVVVKAKNTSGVVTTLVLNTDFTIADADVNTDNGGNVVLTTPATWNTQEIFIIRDTSRTQLVNIESSTPFPAATVTKVFDRLTMMIQEMHYRDRKALRFADSSTFKDINVPDPLNGTFLGWLNSLLANINIGDSRKEETVTLGATTKSVVFDSAQANANYLILGLTTNWATTTEWSNKLTTGFTVTFGTPAPTGAKLVWSVLSQ